jgi:flagellar protein FliS
MHALSSYTAVSQRSASKEQLIILLYERAIKGQIIAIDCLSEGDRGGASDEIRRCREIFIALAGALDHTAAPELSGNLHQLYLWGVRELMRASRTGAVDAVENTLEMTETLYEAMKEALA